MNPPSSRPPHVFPPTPSQVAERRRSIPRAFPVEVGTQTTQRGNSSRSTSRRGLPTSSRTSVRSEPANVPSTRRNHRYGSGERGGRYSERIKRVELGGVGASNSRSSASTLVKRVESIGLEEKEGRSTELFGEGGTGGFSRDMSATDVRVMYHPNELGGGLGDERVRFEEGGTRRRFDKGNDSGSSFRTARGVDGSGVSRRRNLEGKWRLQSERVENTGIGRRVGVGFGRTRSLKEGGNGILGGLFGRGKLVTWPVGVAPRVVYGAERREEMEDGSGGGGLVATLLCKMGSGYREWDIVRGGERVCVRVVGWYDGGNGGVVYSVVNGGKAVVHGEWEGTKGGGVRDGYRNVSEGRGLAVWKEVEVGEVVMLKVGLWRGEDGGGDSGGEVRWRIGGGEDGRGGGVLMRFGYYFFLDRPYGLRLFTNTDTPEHVRLVAKRVGDIGIDEEVSSKLTYVVVRVGAD